MWTKGGLFQSGEGGMLVRMVVNEEVRVRFFGGRGPSGRGFRVDSNEELKKLQQKVGVRSGGGGGVGRGGG